MKNDLHIQELSSYAAPPVPSSPRVFGLVMAAACAVLGTAAWFKNPLSAWVVGLSIAGGLFLILGLFWSTPLKPLNAIWLKFGDLLHRAVSPLFMSIMFYLLITPIGIILRFLGKDILSLKWDEDIQSYWITTTETEQETSMTQQF